MAAEMDPYGGDLMKALLALREELAQAKAALEAAAAQAQQAAAAAQASASAAQKTADAAQKAATKAQTTADAAQKTASAAQKAVKPLAESEVLAAFVKRAQYHKRGGYHVFSIPNIDAWDVYTHGTSFSRNGHTAGGPAWPGDATVW